MTKKITIRYILFFLLFANKFYSQNVNWFNAATLNNTTYEDAKAVCTDNLGNIYVAITFEGIIDCDSGPAVYNLSAAGGYDICIIKYSNSGQFIWAKEISGSGYNDEASDIAVDGSNNVYITGRYQSGTDFDPGPATFTMTAGLGTNTNVFVTKLDQNGNFIWAKQLAAGITVARCSGFSVDAAGNVYVTGGFLGNADFDPGVGVYNLSPIYIFTVSTFICKLDALGNFVWAKNFSGPNGSESCDIKLDAFGFLYVAGYLDSTVDMDPGPTTVNLTSSIGIDSYISKFDINGNFIWAKGFGGAGNEYPVSLTVDNNSNVYLTGIFDGVVDFDPGVASYTLATNGLNDVYINKLDQNGNFVWAKSFGSNNMDETRSVYCDNLNNVYLSASAYGPIDVDPGPATYSVGVNSNGCSFLLKLDQTGMFNWNIELAQYPAPPNVINGWATTTGCCQDASGNIYVSGNISLTVNAISSISGLTNLTNNINKSAFVLKLANCNIPSAPINNTPIANLMLCSGNNATLTAIGSGTINWYSQSSNSVAATGSSFITPALPSGTNTFYITSSNSCGQSMPLVPITLTVNSSPNIVASNTAICTGQSHTIIATGANTYTFSSGTAIVAPGITTSYSITGTGSNNCVSTTPVIVTVSVNPTPTVMVNSGAICSGNAFTINPTGASTYTYSSGTNVVSPTNTSSYSVTGTSGNGCISSTFAISNVTVNALPLVTAITNASIICTGQSATITANGANTYSWSTTSTNTTIVVSPTINTTYTVTGTDANNCSDFSVITQSVSLCTGVVTLNGIKTQQIKIYPNPTNSFFELEVLNYNSITVVEVYNNLGELIISKPVTEKVTNIDLSAFANGLYIVKVQNNNKSVGFSKLLKN